MYIVSQIMGICLTLTKKYVFSGEKLGAGEDDKLILSASMDCSIKIWSASTGISLSINTVKLYYYPTSFIKSYSRTSMAQTLMARLPRLVQTHS